ncbi:MAG: CCA tRNA nucleotidyltransferase [Oscillospiraceae bacterium]|nr:CCA tRNA nucleotidyltransferase [Oscillospiraceae bacterium]
MYLPAYVLKALEILKINGYEGYAVGGCVRDSLLGSAPDDYDIAVSCTPEKTKECFRDFRVIETGIRHGTVTVVIDDHNLELTTFRLDGEYRDMRRPEGVSFTMNLAEDLSRRDFTVNAMAFSDDAGLIDLFAGKADLENSIIRCVGEPDVRFGEDALRILRALRFSSVLGFSVEEKTAASIIKNRDNLKKISSERIFTELKKLLEGKNCLSILINYRDVLISCIPEIENIPNRDYILCAESAALLKNALLSFASLMLPLGSEAADKICRNLKTDNSFRKSVVFLTENAKREFSSAGEGVRFIGAYSREKTEKLCVLREAFGFDASVLKEALKNTGAASKISDLKINGEILLQLGFKGKKIGEALNRLLVAVSNGEIENTENELKKYIKKNS